MSRWRNAVATPAKSEARFEELGLAPAPDNGSLVKANEHWILAKGFSNGEWAGAFRRYAGAPVDKCTYARTTARSDEKRDGSCMRLISLGTLLCLPHDQPGKYAKQAPTFSAASGPM